ncbi:type II toxin-antitoxin system HicB family antitoxin [Streptomyces sp. NPDC051572]|uniref:type II toxin-antitoxin system HicB family antitoxin n=1 Tax=Streptomyces sp. NPDC051572 TaxID=3155802 RepID=UPI00344E4C35
MNEQWGPSQIRPPRRPRSHQLGDARKEGEKEGKGRRMVNTPTFHAVARQDGAYWAVHITDLPDGCVGVTQGRTWIEARRMASDVVSALLDVPEESFKVELRPEDPELADLVNEAEKTREEADKAAKKAAEALATAARILTEKVTVRDAGAILGVSHQYVAKLAPKSG